jgi:hypothetical protein
MPWPSNHPANSSATETAQNNTGCTPKKCNIEHLPLQALTRMLPSSCQLPSLHVRFALGIERWANENSIHA